MQMTTAEKYMAGALYFLAICIWSMQIASIEFDAGIFLMGPLMILTGASAAYCIIRRVRPVETDSEKTGRELRARRSKWMLYSLGVIILFWCVGFLAAGRGWFFGKIIYGGALMPHIAGVPVAPGFLRLSAILGAVGVCQKVIFYNPVYPATGKRRFAAFRKSLIVAMALFVYEFFFEWAGGTFFLWARPGLVAPIGSYFSWLLVYFAVIYSGYKMKLLNKEMPAVMPHFYLAQITFFLIALFK